MCMLLLKVESFVILQGSGRKIKEQEVAIACCDRRKKLKKVTKIANAIRSIGFSIDGFEGMGIRVHINFTFDP